LYGKSCSISNLPMMMMMMMMTMMLTVRAGRLA